MVDKTKKKSEKKRKRNPDVDPVLEGEQPLFKWFKSKSPPKAASGGTIRLKKGKVVNGPASSAVQQIKSIPGHLKAVSKAKKKASGGIVRLKSGGPVVDSYDYS